jgi:hypothetical protein
VILLELSTNLNSDKNIIKIENPCTKTFLLINKGEALKLKTDLNYLIELME